jgi:hypothetical protein
MIKNLPKSGAMLARSGAQKMMKPAGWIVSIALGLSLAGCSTAPGVAALDEPASGGVLDPDVRPPKTDPGPPPPESGAAASTWRGASGPIPLGESSGAFQMAIVDKYVIGSSFAKLAADLATQGFQCTPGSSNPVGRPVADLECEGGEVVSNCYQAYRVSVDQDGGEIRTIDATRDVYCMGALPPR